VDFGKQGVRLLGLTATRLVQRGAGPVTLFPDERAMRQKRTAEAVDRLRRRFGADAVTRARLLEGRAETTGTPSDTAKEE
jgi:hypothetical protein